MSAYDRAADLSGFFQATAQNRRNCFWRDKIHWETHKIQRGYRPAAHRENIRERVGGGDLSIGKRVVHDRCKKVHGLHEGSMSVQTVNAGVVERARIHEDVPIAISW